MSGPNECETCPPEPAEITPPGSRPAADAVEASLRRLTLSRLLLGRTAARMQVTRALLDASLERLGRSSGRPQTTAAGSLNSANPTSAGGAIDITAWPDPCAGNRVVVASRAWGHANDARPQPAAAARKAADLACLAEAALLLGLPKVAETLTDAAYDALNGEISRVAPEAMAALRGKLVIIDQSPAADA